MHEFKVQFYDLYFRILKQQQMLNIVMTERNLQLTKYYLLKGKYSKR